MVDHLLRRARDLVRGGEREDDLARSVRGDAAGAANPQGHVLGDAPQLVAGEWRVGRGHGDDAPVADGALVEVPVLRLEQRPDRQSGDAQVLHVAEVVHHQHAEGVAAERGRKLARGGPDPGLEVAGNHPGTATHGSLGHGPAGGRLQRFPDVLRLHVPSGDVVEPGVVAFADQGNEDVVLVPDSGELLHHPLHRRVADRADAERVGEEDRGLHDPPLHQLREPRDLARAVEDEPSSGDALLEDVFLVRQDGGDARAHGSAAAAQRSRAADDGGVPHQDAFHVGDGVPFAGPETPERDAEIPRAVTRLHARALSRLVLECHRRSAST